MEYFDYLKKQGLPAWPYPVEYGQETTDTADVLIIGGGLSGCFAAVHAARRGASVIVLEKGATIRSGAAGTGIDHWMFCATNPASALTPDEMFKMFIDGDEKGDDPMNRGDNYSSKHMEYIVVNEAYEALLDLEQMGVKIRDTDDDFKGAPFRDEESKLLFAYDYDGKYCIRLFGANLKKALHKEMLRLGVKIYDRTMCTSLLTKDGKQGEKVIGATAINVRTGRFCTFRGKATILATAKPLRLWEFATEKVGSYAAHDDPNCAGDGDAMAWRAGAKLMMMERTTPSSGANRYPAYFGGNASNTWYPTSLVDNYNNPIRWINRDNEFVETVEDRSRTQPGQKAFIPMGPAPYPHRGITFEPDVSGRIRRGELKYPFYADMTEMPESEREVIFGVMLSNEGKGKVPVVRNLGRHGFDPAKDMLQANIVGPEFMKMNLGYWMNNFPGANSDSVREAAFMNYGGLMVDWDTKTSLDGLYAIGNNVAGVEGASTAAALGRYCGRVVADRIRSESLEEANEAQLQAEKERVYRFLNNESGYGWKEVQIGLCHVMQDYCGAVKTREIMEHGLWMLESIRRNELSQICVHNPHELARALECEVRLDVGEAIIQNSLARKSSCPALSFERLDYPQVPSDDDDCFIAVHQTNGIPVSERLSFKYWLEGDNAPTYQENYRRHARIEEVS